MIYRDRPLACREYACLWLNGKGDDSYGPDRLGAVLDVRDLVLSTREVGVLHIFEIRRDALNQDKIKQLVEANKEAGFVVVQYRMQGPRGYSNVASWYSDCFSSPEEDEIRARLNKKDPSVT